MKSYAHALGIQFLDQEIKQINLNDSGAIESIITNNDKCLSGEFFIDATGKKGSLIDSALKISYESWGKALPCNRKKLLTSKPRSTRLIPFSSVQLMPSGWIKNIPLREKVVSEFIYPDSLGKHKVQSDTEDLFVNCDELKFSPGMRQKIWSKNCLALGGAAVNIDSFSHSSLYIAAISLKRFVDHWPKASGSIAAEREFNRLMRLEYEMLRDFNCLHYVLAQKSNTAFSDVLGNIEIPQSLQYRISLFQECGRALAEESTLIHPARWTNIFLGFEYWPKNYDYIARHEPPDRYKKWSSRAKEKIQKEIDQFPDYTTHIQSLLASM